MPDQIELGDSAQDIISGFSGVVIAVTKWLYGCDRISLQPQEMKDGKPIENQAFDAMQLKLLKKGVVTVPNYSAAPVAPAAQPVKTGGPRPEPTRQSTPKL